jgi:ABC-type phosphate transport system permease subunit
MKCVFYDTVTIVYSIVTSHELSCSRQTASHRVKFLALATLLISVAALVISCTISLCYALLVTVTCYKHLMEAIPMCYKLIK